MCWALMAIVSALTAIASIWAALSLSFMSRALAPFSFMSRWRSATTSPEPDLHLGLADDDPDKQGGEPDGNHAGTSGGALHRASFDRPGPIGPGPM